jgi:hypothetical protein
MARSMPEAPKTWILTGSPENFDATREHGFRLIGMKERRRTPGNPDPCPWRLETEPEVVLDEDEWVPAGELRDGLEHVRKWPAEHWRLAFQGQLRTVSDADAALLLDRMRAAAGTPA